MFYKGFGTVLAFKFVQSLQHYTKIGNLDTNRE